MSVERHSNKYKPSHRKKQGNKVRVDRRGSKLHKQLVRAHRLMQIEREHDARERE
jgi:hypothetical protein